MANGRGVGRKGDKARVSGGFVALPWAVLDCAAYADLSHPAKALLVDIARQYVRDNNGRLLASAAHLAKRGWRSVDVITRAKRELIDAGFVHETVKGHRPNKASWYAVTWYLLDPHPGYDPGAAATFERGRYERQGAAKNAVLRPSGGAKGSLIAPWDGVGDVSAAPSGGAIKALSDPLPAPSGGDHLETPSAESVSGDGETGEGALDTDGSEPEFIRERDGDIEARRFTPITGEFDPVPEPRPKLAKQAASAFVAAGLEAIKNRRKGVRHG
jgi:hypothetical protein